MKKLDGYSYQCGVIDAFNEVVRAGVKRIALSHPVDTKEEAMELIPFSQQICQQYGNHFYLEESPLLTDLFPISLNKGKYNIIYYRQEEDIRQYLALKKRKQQLLEQQAYQGEARRQIAVDYGKLLSYSQEAIERYLAQNEEKESNKAERGKRKMKHPIIPLPQEQWQDAVLPIGYTTTEYYDVSLEQNADGFSLSIQKKPLEEPITRTPQGHDFPDRLFAAHWQGARAWGIVEDGKLLGAIELCAEEWSNRLRVTELWVDPSLQKLGYGHALMEIAKQQARLAHRRALILETQSANANAIGFYLHEGFELIGLDLCCYTNCDIRRKDVRLELGWFPQD